MEIKKINIAEVYNLNGNAFLTAFSDLDYLDHGKIKKQPAMLICPGGGYGMVSKREGTPVAIEFLSHGFTPFVLTYSVGKEFSYPTQLNEVAASIDYIRRNADDLGIDEDKIYLIGFSAGGHLVANIGVEYPELADKYDAMPNGVCLCYPVITSEFGYSGGTYDNLLNNYSKEDKEKLLNKLSFTTRDLSKFPPCFIWTTANDGCVMSQNSIAFVSKLVEAKVKCEFHMYPDGKHGISIGTEAINNNEEYLAIVRTWVKLCVDFFKNLK